MTISRRVETFNTHQKSIESDPIDFALINIEYPPDKQAFFATSSVMGGLGFFTAFIMIYLMREKRQSSSDRRKPINRWTFWIDAPELKDALDTY